MYVMWILACTLLTFTKEKLGAVLKKHTLMPQNNSVCLQFQQPSSHLPSFPLLRAMLARTSPTAASMNPQKKPLRDTQVHPPWTHPFLPLKSTYTFDLQRIVPRRSNYCVSEKALSQDESLELPSLKSAFPDRAALHGSCLAAQPPPFAHCKGFAGFL